jgi:signal transduction histidine kinase
MSPAPGGRLREALDRLLPGTKDLSLTELRRLRLTVGASLLLVLVSALAAPFSYGLLRDALATAMLVVTVVLMTGNVLLARRQRSGRVAGVVVCCWLAFAYSLAALKGAGGYVFQYFLVVPLLASFLLGPRLGMVFTGGMVLELLFLDGLVLGLLPPTAAFDRAGTTLLTLLVGAFTALSERVRETVERQRDEANEWLLAMAREQAALHETELLRAREARNQALRADTSTALSEPGSLPAALQACCAAMLRHLQVQSAGIWLLASEGPGLELGAGAGGLPDDDATALSLATSALGGVARELRPVLTNDGTGDEGEEGWMRREGLRARVACPLRLGGHLVGVMAVYASRALGEDVLAAISAAADAIAQGIERKRAEEELALRARELARSNEELERFAYVASHDLQEPLRMVASYTQLLARRYRGKLDADADEFISFAVNGVARMQRLIQDLLAYSRVGKSNAPLPAIDPGPVFAGCLANLKAVIEATSAVITADPLPVVRADPGLLGQLLQNLMSNALKFRRKDLAPRLHLSVQRREREWQFSLRDNGIGMEPRYFERIFVLFQRLHTQEDYPGTGIGLALCKKIVERHGGRIWVESTVGQGSTFHFTLPRAE